MKPLAACVGRRPLRWLACTLIVILVASASGMLAQNPSRPKAGQPSTDKLFDERYALTSWELPRPQLIAWGQTLKPWLKSAPDNARALLAFGAWLECLNAPSRDSTGYRALADSFPTMWIGCLSGRVAGGTRECANEARKRFERSLKADATLVEARLRLAGLDASDAFPGAEVPRGRQALTDLARQANDVTIRYLASMSLAVAQLKKRDGDLDEAGRWFEYARGLNPDWLSARIGVAAVAARQQRPVGRVELNSAPGDPWHSYPCRILTPDVALELDKWSRSR